VLVEDMLDGVGDLGILESTRSLQHLMGDLKATLDVDGIYIENQNRLPWFLRQRNDVLGRVRHGASTKAS
jgi:hypothetical protein